MKLAPKTNLYFNRVFSSSRSTTIVGIDMDRTMRRKVRSMSLKDTEELLEKAPVGRLGLSWKDEPYVVPLNFVYYQGRIYFHCAKEGKKLDYIANNPRVCFEVDDFIGIKKGENPCNFSTYYRSVIAFGEARIIKNVEEKEEALRMLFRKYARKRIESFFDLMELGVVEILVKRLTGKHHIP